MITPQITDLFHAGMLDDEIANGYVNVGRHPTLPLAILTYSREAQYSQRWNEVTMACRGLIYDTNTGDVVARPLPKFFAAQMHGKFDFAKELPNEEFDVYEKLDGSLAIIYWYEGKWRAASKGSFISDQAVWAQNRIDEKFGTPSIENLHTEWYKLDPFLTYCAELIYPTNRIVVDYGNREDIVLLAAFTKAGGEIDISVLDWPLGSKVTRFSSSNSHEGIVNLISNCENSLVGGTEFEGYVARFKSGLRTKVKLADYLRIHRLMTGVTERDIWRAVGHDVLNNAGITDLVQQSRVLKCQPNEIVSYNDLVLDAPDEFQGWADTTRDELMKNFGNAFTAVTLATIGVGYLKHDRPEFAHKVKRLYPESRLMQSCLFAKLDQRPISGIIWKSLYPSVATVFKQVGEDDG